MQKSQTEYMEEVKAIKAKQEELWNNTNRFHSKIRKEQDMLAREIQEIRKGQINQTLISGSAQFSPTSTFFLDRNQEVPLSTSLKVLAETVYNMSLNRTPY
ncbi:hypothetical protein PIB30_054450, partial [Stylosanthes scabra]|nr:hypothetical protein [Stylosanthes scabra]